MYRISAEAYTSTTHAHNASHQGVSYTAMHILTDCAWLIVEYAAVLRHFLQLCGWRTTPFWQQGGQKAVPMASLPQWLDF